MISKLNNPEAWGILECVVDLQGSNILGASEPQSSVNIAGNSAHVKKTEMCLNGSEWTLKAFQDFRGK